jgi:hypothetical protein
MHEKAGEPECMDRDPFHRDYGMVARTRSRAVPGNDWIVDCAAQLSVRDLIDTMITGLGG